MAKRQTLFIDKCFRDKSGDVVLAQWPNVPVIVGVVALVLAWAFGGLLEFIALMVAFGAWFTWAWLEVFQGVNYFRRGLGVLGFVILLAAVIAVYFL